VHERLLTDSASSTKAPEADIREDWDEFANDHNGRSTADCRRVLKRQFVGHCGRWFINASMAGIGSDDGRAILVSGCFDRRRTAVHDHSGRWIPRLFSGNLTTGDRSVPSMHGL
jgi:hypothetical protein